MSIIEERPRHDVIFTNIFTNEKYEFKKLKLVLMETIFQVMVEFEILDYKNLNNILEELFHRVIINT